MLRIRLRRMGSNQKPFYRLVVSDSRKTPRGRFVDIVGYYDPKSDPPVIEMDSEKVDHWISRGAHPSDTVASLIRQTRAAQD